MEEWKDIKNYEGLYQISSLGRVKSLPKERNNGINNEIILKQCTDKKGYKRVNLYKNKKSTRVLVHRLVAEAFLNNPNNYPLINIKIYLLYIQIQIYNLNNFDLLFHLFLHNYVNLLFQ